MGIRGLLPALQSIRKNRHLREFRGHAIAIDGYAWMHRAAFAALHDVVLAAKPDYHKVTKFCVKRIEMMKSFGCRPILVFDGKSLPSKAATNQLRREQRVKAKQQAEKLIARGDKAGAYRAMGAAVSITHEMVVQMIAACRKIGIECIVAPYEADAQLGFLSHINYVSAVVSEDSDLVLYGCKCVLFKLDDAGACQSVEAVDLPHAGIFPPEKYSEDAMILLGCISGCDYIVSIRGIGIKKGAKFVTRALVPNLESLGDDGVATAAILASRNRAKATTSSETANGGEVAEEEASTSTPDGGDDGSDTAAAKRELDDAEHPLVSGAELTTLDNFKAALVSVDSYEVANSGSHPTTVGSSHQAGESHTSSFPSSNETGAAEALLQSFMAPTPEERLCWQLKAGGFTVPEAYDKELKRAWCTFKHQTVWHPRAQALVRRHELSDSDAQDKDLLLFMGPFFDDAAGVCQGSIHPHTGEEVKLPMMQIPKEARRNRRGPITTHGDGWMHDNTNDDAGEPKQATLDFATMIPRPARTSRKRRPRELSVGDHDGKIDPYSRHDDLLFSGAPLLTPLGTSSIPSSYSPSRLKRLGGRTLMMKTASSICSRATTERLGANGVAGELTGEETIEEGNHGDGGGGKNEIYKRNGGKRCRSKPADVSPVENVSEVAMISERTTPVHNGPRNSDGCQGTQESLLERLNALLSPQRRRGSHESDSSEDNERVSSGRKRWSPMAIDDVSLSRGSWSSKAREVADFESCFGKAVAPTRVRLNFSVGSPHSHETSAELHYPVAKRARRSHEKKAGEFLPGGSPGEITILAGIPAESEAARRSTSMELIEGSRLNERDEDAQRGGTCRATFTISDSEQSATPKPVHVRTSGSMKSISAKSGLNRRRSVASKKKPAVSKQLSLARFVR